MSSENMSSNKGDYKRCFSKVVWINSTSMLMLCSMVNYRHDSVTLLSCVLKCYAFLCINMFLFLLTVSSFVYFATLPYVCVPWSVCVCVCVCVYVCVCVCL